MTNDKIEFKDWIERLETAWNLKTEEDCDAFGELMDMITGEEDLQFADKLIDAVRLAEDNGVYESLYNALWLFPGRKIGQLLAKRLPEFQRRMGKHDQVSRFYIPIANKGASQEEFIKESENWTPADGRTAISALKKWAMESEDWEAVLAKLGKPVKKKREDPIPSEWPVEWKKRLEKGRKTEGEYGLSGILWNGSKKNWLNDLDFLLEMLALNHGAKWRQVNVMTNPLWGYAKTTVYPEFISRFSSLAPDKQAKILKNIKKCNRLKYTKLINDLQLQ